MHERVIAGAPSEKTRSAGLSPWLRAWLRRRVFRGLPTGGARTRLRYRRLYILPTRNGLLFALMLFAMWLGAINYNNSMIYLLTFLLASVAIVSILHTFRNLIGLEVTALPAEPVFAGGTARFPLQLSNPGRRPRVAIGLQYRKTLQELIDLDGLARDEVALELPAIRRGHLAPDRCALISIFPTGLFRAWSWLDLELGTLVYPAPEAGPVPHPPETPGGSAGGRRGAGQEDFQGRRDYRPGDSFRHSAWRRAARGGELQTKQFEGESTERIWFDWDSLPGLDTEARLSRLCRWVLDADAAARPYGLRLPGVAIEPAQGRAHRRRCLDALALYPP